MWMGIGFILVLLALPDKPIVSGTGISSNTSITNSIYVRGECDEGMVQCLNSTQCIHDYQLCDDDKEENCDNGSDEWEIECKNEELDFRFDIFFGEKFDDDIEEDQEGVPCPTGTFSDVCNCTQLCSTNDTIGACTALSINEATMDCSDRFISHFPVTFPDITIKLDLSTNQITTIRRHYLSNLTQLRELDLRRNNIQIIDVDAFEPLKQLETLHLEASGLGNRVFGVLRNLTSLKYLDLSHNGIRSLKDDDLQGLISLTHLDLDDNNIRELRPQLFADLESLIQLYLSRNSLYVLESKTFSELKNLETLHMVACELREIPTGLFSKLHKLETLDLAHNLLTSITKAHLVGLTSLRYLYLKDNRISYIEPGAFEKARNIFFLQLNSNRLTAITRVMFEPLQLITLALKENVIETIEDKSFSNQASLGDLDLSDNFLTVIRNGTFLNLTQLSSLYLRNNSIHTLQMGCLDTLLSLVGLDLRLNPFMSFPPDLFEALGRNDPLNLEWVYFDHFHLCGYAPRVRHCIPRTDGISSTKNLLANALLRSSVWIVAVLAFIGNLCVLLARCFLREDNRIHSFFITNLAVADLLMGLYLIIIGSYDMIFRGDYILHDITWRNSPMCKICGFLSFLSSEMSVMTLSVITLDRFICIVHPFKFKNRFLGQAAILMVCLWILWITLGALPVLHTAYFGNYFYGANGVCLPLQINYPYAQGWEFSLIIFVIFNLMAFIFIVYAYLKMFLTIRWSSLAMRSTKKNQEWPLVKRFGLIVFTDFLCWMPIIIMKFVAFGGVQVSNGAYAWFAIFVLPVNSALNPILYTMTTKLFKQKILIPLGILQPKRQKPYDPNSSVDDSLVSKASGTRLSVISSKSRGSVHANKSCPQVKTNVLMSCHPSSLTEEVEIHDDSSIPSVQDNSSFENTRE
ncbi:uncharacterized protein [Amphiura filiformis]|uniref:uncharacterized protein n=1 Tax=Amphiura filiformis TaxID=82378 RepID=UPI003B217DD3